jgi:hypothetical protein
MKDNIKKVVLFIVLTFFCNWLMAFLFFALGGQTFTPAWFIMAVIYMFIPMTIAIVVQWFIYESPLKAGRSPAPDQTRLRRAGNLF